MSVPVVLYAEVPGFYAAVERARDPALRGRPVVVGGDPRKRGQVQSASPEATAMGIREGMSMLEALEHCPRARAIRTDLKAYREMSSALQSCLRSELDALEPSGLGAAFLDGSRLLEDPESVARTLRERVREELALSLRVGIAPLKFLAQLAAEESGEEGLLRVRPGEESAFLAPLSVARLPGVGPKTAARLAELGARNVAELLTVRPERLERELGRHGMRILDFARGHDPSLVRAARHPRTLSQEATLEASESDRTRLGEQLLRLAAGIEDGLRRQGQGMGARRVALKVRFEDGGVTTRSRTLDAPIAAGAEIAEVGAELLERVQAGGRLVRGLGLAVGNLTRGAPDSRQLDLFRSSAPPETGR